jgi:GntR family transcriptional regulator
MNFQQTRSIYMQIAEYMGDKILAGEWPEEERIPSIRETAVTLEVNANTVVRAYELLEAQAVIYNQRGIGFFTTKGAVKTLLKTKKAELIKAELPQVFKKLQQLELSPDELKEAYEKFLKQQ